MTEEASHDELQEVLNRRVATGHSTQPEIDLRGHIDQLKVLYDHVQPFRVGFGLGGQLASLVAVLPGSTPNPRYPKEGFEDFILRMIEEKKKRIQRELNV